MKKHKDDNNIENTEVVQPEENLENTSESPEVTQTPEDQEPGEVQDAPAEAVEAEEDLPPEEEISYNEPVKKTINELSEIDPELLTGKDNGDDGNETAAAITEVEKEPELNIIEEIELDLEGDGPRDDPDVIVASDGVTSRRKSRGLAFVISAVILLIAVLFFTFFLQTGGDEKLQSPLTVGKTSYSSSEFSFMYHYVMVYEGVDLFAPGTAKMLKSAYDDDPKYKTYKDYFLDITAQRIQTMEILYDDAKEHGLSIEDKHYKLARTYIDWLQTKADELKLPLDTYIKGAYGKQVDEDVIVNTLAKKYFTDDYANKTKLEELSASAEQAEEAYNADRNTYDLVSYKFLRITYEQREEGFIETANLRANQIIEKMAGDPSKFEEAAASFFSGASAEEIAKPDSRLVADCRFEDITHEEFRNFLFSPERKPGDSTIFKDGDGFPIVLVFVKRDRMQTPVRNVYITHVFNAYNDDGTPNMSKSQSLSQEIYDYINDESSCEELENAFNGNVIDGEISINHNEYAYRYEYEKEIDDWIFSPERELGNKALIETDDGFFVIYYISESANPEWYDRVNSFISRNNYQEFLDSKLKEYAISFNPSGLESIQDVP